MDFDVPMEKETCRTCKKEFERPVGSKYKECGTCRRLPSKITKYKRKK